MAFDHVADVPNWAGYASPVFVLLVCLLLIGGIGLWAVSMKRRSRFPPAPPGWRPVLGHLLLLGERPHQVLAELARRHGPKLMSLRLGSVLIVVASKPEAAQLLLQTHDQAMAGRPTSAVAAQLHFNRSTIISSDPNPHWRRLRQICSINLLSNKRIQSFQPIRVKAVQSLLRAVLAQHGQVMQMRPYLLVSSMDVISKMTIGCPLSELSADAPALMSEMVHLLGKFNVGDFIPWLACLDLQGYEKCAKLAMQRWNSLLQGLVDLRRSAASNSKPDADIPPSDLLDTLLLVPDLTDNNIKAVLADMFIGGTETSSITIEWAFAELIANPAAMGTLKAELDAVVGRKRLVQEEDLPRLPYLHAVVKEAMRIHPVAPLLVPHEAMQTCEVHGYLIPAKARILINVWAIGRDPSVWDNPLEFQPERFMPEGKHHHVNAHGQHFQLLPFGSGRRKCPGLVLGLLSVEMVLASLVQAFDWALPQGARVDLSEEVGMSATMECPLAIMPSPRLELSLYD